MKVCSVSEGKTLGRPRKYGCKRTALQFRVTPAMHELLVARCALSKRSLSEEVEQILEKVFFPEDPEVIRLIRAM